MAGPIVISVLGDTRDLVRGLGDAEGKLGKFGKVAGGLGKIAGAGLAAAGAAAVGFGVAAVKSASDAQQSLGATSTVFGKYADQVTARSNDAAQAYGLSANEYRESANLIGALFKNQGVSLDQLGGKTDKMIGTASDLAATFGGTTSDAVGALSAAFKGEFDSLEKYGISLKASTISAELAARGQENLTGKALDAAKQQATTRLIMQQAGDAAGAFGREANTLAGQQQRLGASWENLKAKAGGVLLPVLTSLAMTANNTLLPALEAAGPPIMALGAALGDRLGPVVRQIGGVFSSVLLPVFKTWSATMTGQVIPAVAGVGRYLVGTFAPIVRTIVGIFVGRVLPTLAAFARFIYGQVVPAVVRIARQVAGNLRPILDQVAATIRGRIIPVLKMAAARFEEWRPTIQRVISVTVKIIGTVLKFASAILGKVLPVVIRFAGFLIGNLFKAVFKVIGVVVKIIGKVIDFGGALVDGGRKVGEFAGKIGKAVGDALEWFNGLPGKALRAVGDLGGVLLDAGRNLIQGLIDGIDDKISAVTSRLDWLTSKLPDWKGPASRDKRVLTPAGRLLIEGLIAGIDERVPDLRRSLEGVTREVASTRLPGLDLAASSRAAATPRRLRGAAGIAGGVTYNIRLEVPVGASSASIGRELVRHIDAYEAVGGRRRA